MSFGTGKGSKTMGIKGTSRKTNWLNWDCTDLVVVTLHTMWEIIHSVRSGK